MGQYHTVYNKTKKECFSYGGAKLWEKAYNQVHSMGLMVLLCNSNNRGGGDLCNPIHQDIFGKGMKKLKTPRYRYWSNEKQKFIRVPKSKFDEIEAALNLIQGRWSGDEIIVQGDYAEEGDPSFLKDTDDYRDITRLVVDAFEAILSLKTDPDSEEMRKSIEFEKQYLR